MKKKSLKNLSLNRIIISKLAASLVGGAIGSTSCANEASCHTDCETLCGKECADN